MIDLTAVYSQGLQPVVFLAINKTHVKKKLNFHENRVCIGRRDLLRKIKTFFSSLRHFGGEVD